MVVINGLNTAMGRTPNLGSYYTYQTHGADTSITSSNLTGTPNWTGAQVVIRKASWIWQIGTITSQSGGAVYYADAGTFTPQNNWGFFIQNDLRTLDNQNEWYYNPSTKKIDIYSTTTPSGVQVASIDQLFIEHNKSYITINNISFTGANSDGIYFDGGSYQTIQNNFINYSGLEGIYLYWPTYTTTNNNIIKNSNYSAIFGDGHSDNATITNNTIDSTTLILGVGRLLAPGAIYYSRDSLICSYNKIDHSGYDGILLGASAHATIGNNFINHSLLNRSDGGGIYTGGVHTAVTISGNIVLNSFGDTTGTNGGTPEGNGIYLDEGTTNVTVLNNTCAYNGTSGIYLNDQTSFNTIKGNKCFGNSSQFRITTFTGATDVSNITVLNNKFVAKDTSQLIAEYRSALNNIPTFFAVSDSNYFARPINDPAGIRAGQPNSYGTDYKTLAQWQTFSGLDAHSHKSPKTISSVNSLRFEYNTDSTSKTIDLGNNYMDVTGATYNGSITLAPYSSVILIEGKRKLLKYNGKILTHGGKAFTITQ
jgi:parallel beta-helix repeat protein